MKQTDVAVIGGGAAGLASAAAAAESGARVTLLEKNDRLGRKLFLTGHGRCNVTNSAPISEYQKKIWRNPKFVQSALHRFTPQDLQTFLAQNGIRLKEEDSGRMFPVTDHSSDIIRAFRRALEKNHVDIELSTAVDKIQKLENAFVIRTGNGTFQARCVVICTGGLSYPSTGSTGDGYTFAERFGHDIVPACGALVGLVTDWPGIASLAGLTLHDICLTLIRDADVFAREEGDLLFTHTGLSGPCAFRASCRVPPGMQWPAQAYIDLLPRRQPEQIDAHLKSLTASSPNREVRSVLEEQIPKRLVQPVAEQALEGDGRLRLNQLSRERRRQVIRTLKGFAVPITGLRPVSEAIITSGGINVRELDPRTMESRVTAHLFFAGEVIDVSAMTGGYNLQIAFSTGWAAGEAAAQAALQLTSGPEMI